MPRGSHIRQLGLTQTFAALALLAMIVRAFVPAGYMVAPEQDGRFVSLVLCSGHSGQDVFFDQATGEIVDAATVQERQAPANPQTNDGPCVFATMAAMAAPETPSAISAPYRHESLEAPANNEVTPGRGLAAPPPWATGPPAQA